MQCDLPFHSRSNQMAEDTASVRRNETAFGSNTIVSLLPKRKQSAGLLCAHQSIPHFSCARLQTIRALPMT